MEVHVWVAAARIGRLIEHSRARWIVEFHAGTIELANGVGGGTVA